MADTTQKGYKNLNGQENLGRTDRRGNDHNQFLYRMRCSRCSYEYYANGSDIWQRKCPKCGGGRPSSGQ